MAAANQTSAKTVALTPIDGVIGAALVAAMLLYLSTWPRDLLPADEGTVLYEAKRVLNGDPPTPFELMIPGYNTADQFLETVETLEERQVPLVVRIAVFKPSAAKDTIFDYVVERYAPVPFTTSPRMVYGLFARTR